MKIIKWVLEYWWEKNWKVKIKASISKVFLLYIFDGESGSKTNEFDQIELS